MPNTTVLPVNIEALINGNVVENNRIEFKRGWNPDAIYRSVCAFANDFDNIGGGYVVIGVDEVRGRAVRPVAGVPIEALDDIQKEIIGYNNLMQPYYAPRISIEDVDGKKVIVLWVTAGDKRPYKVPEQITAKNKVYQYYIRYASSSIIAKGDDAIELMNLANRVPFDDRGNHTAQIEDISKVLLRDYLVETRSKLAEQVEEMPTLNVLEQMDLVTLPKETMQIKNAAIMMFCYRPERFFPRTQVDIVVYPKGKDEDPDHFTELPPIKGPVHHIIRKTLEYLKTMVIRQRVEKVTGQEQAIVKWNYPYQAIEEAVVNALYHRSYQEREPVEINIMPDQIEIISYNGPDRSLNINDLKTGKRVKARRYRNSRLGDFLKELRLTEGRGTGLPTIRKELERNGSPAVSFDVDEGRTYFLISIPCHKDLVCEEIMIDEDGKIVAKDETYSERVAEKVAEKDPYSERVAEKVAKKGPYSERVAEKESLDYLKIILAAIKEDQHIKIPELVSQLKVSHVTVKKYLSQLVTQGYIKRQGRTRGASWIILKHDK